MPRSLAFSLVESPDDPDVSMVEWEGPVARSMCSREGSIGAEVGTGKEVGASCLYSASA